MTSLCVLLLMHACNVILHLHAARSHTKPKQCMTTSLSRGWEQ